MEPLKFGVNFYPHSRLGGPAELVDLIVLCERLGFNHVGLGEHFLVPSEMKATLDEAWYDNFAVAASAFSRTSRIKIVFGIVIVPLHNPVLLAKSIATVDLLSKGRVIMGAGLGWVKQEFEIFGVPFHERAARTEDYLRACKALWTSDTPSYQGRFISFHDVSCKPRPFQQPHPPIWIGGAAKETVRRAVTLGDGLQTFGGPFSKMVQIASETRALLEKSERDPATFALTFTFDFGSRVSRHLTQAGAHDYAMTLGPEPDRALEQLDAAQRAGYNHITVRFPGGNLRLVQEQVSQFSENVLRPAGAVIPN